MTTPPGGTATINIATDADAVGVGIGIGLASSSGSGSGNNPPVLDPISDQNITPGEAFSLQVHATDPDNDPITYSASGLPMGLSIDPSTGLVSGTLPNDGTYPAGTRIPVSFSASDGRGGIDTVAINLVVVAPQVTVTIQEINNTTEGSDTLGRFRLTRAGDTTQQLTVNFIVLGSATPGADYARLDGTTDGDPSHGTVMFAAGSATADLTVTAYHDTVYDPDETVQVTVVAGTGYTVGDPDSATVTITDDSRWLVNTTADTGDSGLGNGFPIDQNGKVSLRAAVQYANGNPLATYVIGFDPIVFPGG